MNSNKRPLAVTIVACVYLAVGVIGFAYHFRELVALQNQAVWVELTEFLALVCGAFMLGGHNWARWLALAWMAFPKRLSRVPGVRHPRGLLCRDCLVSFSSRRCAVFSW